MTHRNLTNDSLDTIITIEAETAQVHGLESTDALDAAFAERSWRIAQRQAEIAQAELDWIAELDEAIAKDEKRLTVKLTAAQADLLHELLPESSLDLEILSTRVKGSRANLQDAIEFITNDDALDLAERNRMMDLTIAQERFAERQTIRCAKGLRKALRKATA